MMFYDPERNLIVYQEPALTEVEGAMALGDYVAFEGTLRNLQTLHTIESAIGSLSVRGILAILLVLSICIYPLCRVTVPETLTTLAISIVSFYFGKSQK